MGKLAKKFVARAPRYVIRPHDERFLRFAHQDDHSRSYTTKLVNVSSTGLAFVVDRDCTPALGDMIKVEFPVGDERFAWWARVARLGEYNESLNREEQNDPSMISDEVLVGIQFHDLPEGHTKKIRKELEVKFLEVLRKEQRAKILNYLEYLAKNFWSILIYGICILFTIAVLFWLANPIGSWDKYDPKKGTPWGERFDF